MGLKPDLKIALGAIRARVGRLLIFSFKVFVLFIVSGALIAMGLSGLTFSIRKVGLFGTWFGLTTVLLTPICMALLVIPASARLILDEKPNILPLSMNFRAFLSAIAATVALLVLAHFISAETPFINLSFETQGWLRIVVWPMLSIIGNIPILFFFVVLSLLAHQNQQMPAIPSPS
jgi:uncharacterized membrane protein